MRHTQRHVLPQQGKILKIQLHHNSTQSIGVFENFLVRFGLAASDIESATFLKSQL